MIRAIQRRAPNFSSSRLLGTSHKKYETKKLEPGPGRIRSRTVKVPDHLQRREVLKIDAVDERNEVTDRQERNDADMCNLLIVRASSVPCSAIGCFPVEGQRPRSRPDSHSAVFWEHRLTTCATSSPSSNRRLCELAARPQPPHARRRHAHAHTLDAHTLGPRAPVSNTPSTKTKVLRIQDTTSLCAHAHCHVFGPAATPSLRSRLRRHAPRWSPRSVWRRDSRHRPSCNRSGEAATAQTTARSRCHRANEWSLSRHRHRRCD